MMAKLIIAGMLSAIALSSHASLITVDADDFEPGSLITGNLEGLDIRVIDGSSVYAAPLIGDGQVTPTGFVDSGPIGERVFSSSPTQNIEWILPRLEMPTLLNIEQLTSYLPIYTFLVEFENPVEFVSLLTMELFGDAGYGGGHDPILLWAFSSDGNLISRQTESSRIHLPGVDEYQNNPFAYFNYEFSSPDIGYLAVGGWSEPTTIDRLQFRYAKVPEPATLSLLALGLAAIGIRRRLKLLG
ncbi:PEP-CTERM sorting domain-containing protein [Marinobacter sp.]|uniref:PEP-CTERM sorting domain-containing protein n=1 Tax=Marinobacter sp. TaxID=50741 RepID=UPI0035C788C5